MQQRDSREAILGKRFSGSDVAKSMMENNVLCIGTRKGIQGEARLACAEHGDASIELDGL